MQPQSNTQTLAPGNRSDWSTGPCVRPIELVGTHHDTGDTRKILVRCGSRRASVCPSCSELYRGDARRVVRACTDNTEGVMLWLTATAPSFGRVHRIDKHTRRRCSCGRYHRPDRIDLAGAPLDPDSYDYANAVRWNRTAPTLWAASIRSVRRSLADLDPTASVLVVKVAEAQRRGAMHYHGLVVVEGATLSPHRLAGVFADAFGADGATATGPDDFVARWGAQVMVVPMAADDVSDKANYVAKYATKDAGEHRRSAPVGSPAGAHLARLTAEADAQLRPEYIERVEAWAIASGEVDSGARVLADGDDHRRLQLEARLRSLRHHWLQARAGVVVPAGAPASLRRAVAAARPHWLAVDDFDARPLSVTLPRPRPGWLAAATEAWGYGGHFLTKSHGWPVTFAEVRALRSEWWNETNGSTVDPDPLDDWSWEFVQAHDLTRLYAPPTGPPETN